MCLFPPHPSTTDRIESLQSTPEPYGIIASYADPFAGNSNIHIRWRRGSAPRRSRYQWRRCSPHQAFVLRLYGRT
ncbi:hypothetical protein KC330_g72 [Hortaea werneckii]|nr:hypothetical protein KC330_g72 [Hortaea werneckii]